MPLITKKEIERAAENGVGYHTLATRVYNNGQDVEEAITAPVRKRTNTTHYKPRTKGDLYRPIVKVNKSKNGVPTSIELSGHHYALVHADYINGGKNKEKK